MFSTLNISKLLSDIDTKLDNVILAQEATELRVKSVEDGMASLTRDVNTAFENKDAEITDLKADILAGVTRMNQLEELITELTNKQGLDLSALKKQCKKLGEDTVTLERYTRSFNLRLFNIAESEGEKTHDVINKVNTLIHQVTGHDIKVEYGHRTGPKRNDGKQRAIICRIASRQDRAEVMGRRQQFFLKGHPIYDDLPSSDLDEKKKHSVVMKEKWANKQKTQFIRGKWYLNGQVYNGE